MVTEESAELMGAVRENPDVVAEIIEEAAAGGAIAKAGAKFSADHQGQSCARSARSCEESRRAHGEGQRRAPPVGEAADHMDKCEKCIGKADGALESINYKDKDDAADVKLVDAPNEDVIAKATAPLIERLTKAEEAAALVPDLLKRLKTLEDQPMPAKGVTRIIGKGEEELTADEVSILAKATPQDIALAQIKKAHRDGGQRIA